MVVGVRFIEAALKLDESSSYLRLKPAQQNYEVPDRMQTIVGSPKQLLFALGNNHPFPTTKEAKDPFRRTDYVVWLVLVSSLPLID